MVLTRTKPCVSQFPSTGIVQILDGDSVELGSFLVELALSIGSTTSVIIAGFPPGTVSLAGQDVTGSSVTVSSLGILDTLVLTPSTSDDFSLRINNKLSVPVIVLPVASKPRIVAPSTSIVDVLSLQVQRTDPDEILAVELRVGTDAALRPLGSIVASMDIPGIVMRDIGGGVYRIESVSSLLSAALVEMGINLLLGDSLAFVPNPEAESGDYGEGVKVIVTSTDTDGEEQLATAIVAIFLPVTIANANPTSSPTESPTDDLSIFLVEDVPKQIGNDIARLVLTLLPSSTGPFRIYGFPPGTFVSYFNRGAMIDAAIGTFRDAIELSDLDDLKSLVVTAPTQSDENFQLSLVNESSSGISDVPVTVLAVADRPKLLVSIPDIVSRDGASVGLRVYPAYGDDIDGSECLSVIFEVALDIVTRQSIGSLSFDSRLPLHNGKFTEIGAGRYKIETPCDDPLINASLLRLLLGNGAVVFSPFPGISGEFQRGLMVTVRTQERAGTF